LFHGSDAASAIVETQLYFITKKLKILLAKMIVTCQDDRAQYFC